MLLSLTLSMTLLGAPGQAREAFDTPDPTDDNATTGPEVGEPIPTFEARDADGKTWSFDSIKGPNGAVLLFYRSADW